MFPELNKYIEEEIKPTVESTGEFLRKLNGARTRVRNKIAKSQEQIKYMKNETKYVADQKPQVEKDAKKVSKDILFNNVTTALRTNKEFDDPLYRLPLLEAIEDNDTYLVRMYGSGFSSRVSVDINLNKSGGTLDMWASAIKAARKQLGVHVPNKNNKNYAKMANAASKAWARHYAGKDEKYTTMIETRLELSAKPAPFWSILNFGTPPGMKSDRGGYPTPKNKETNFIHKAEVEIKSAVAGFFDTLKEDYNNAFSEYEKFLEDAMIIQADLDNMADEIRLDINTNRRLERELGLDIQDIDRNKLDKAVEDVRKNLTQKKSFAIGRSGVRKTISRRTIAEYLNG